MLLTERFSGARRGELFFVCVEDMAVVRGMASVFHSFPLLLSVPCSRSRVFVVVDVAANFDRGARGD